MFLSRRTPELPTPDQALRGRPNPEFSVPDRHTVLGNPLLGPYPEGLEVADFGLGCFWGAERKFWQTEGVWTTLVGYQGGYTAEPDVRRGLLGPDRPHRGGPRRLRPEGRLVRVAAEAVLGVPRPDAGLPPGQRRGHAVPLGDLHPLRRPGRGRGRPRARRTSRS